MKSRKTSVRIKRAGAWCLMAAFGFLFVLSAYKAGRTLFQAEKEDRAFAALAEEAAEKQAALASDETSGEFDVPYAFLKEKNPDFFGWLSIPDTRLNYPVMYTPDDPEYYLRRAFDKSNSDSGVPFVGEGYRAEGNHTMIYGHNMKNGTMFATLLSYAEESFWKEHPVILLAAPDAVRRYQVFGAFYSNLYPEAETDVFRFYQCSDLEEKEAFENYVDEVQAASLYSTDVQPEYGGELLTLATCSYHTREGRFVVAAYCEKEEPCDRIKSQQPISQMGKKGENK